MASRIIPHPPVRRNTLAEGMAVDSYPRPMILPVGVVCARMEPCRLLAAEGLPNRFSPFFMGASFPLEPGTLRQKEVRFMSAALITLIVIVVLLIFRAGPGRHVQWAGDAAEPVQNAFSQIDVQLKRRYDLIPNLVEVAKGYIKHERETLKP